MKIIGIIDFETTALSPLDGKVIEVALALSQVEDGFRLGPVFEVYESFNDPETPIPKHIASLTNINDEMVRGKRINCEQLRRFCEKADLLIAHNAKFDRQWLESLVPCSIRAWGCTSRMVEWKKLHGIPCGNLKHIAWEHGIFPTKAHRAMDDVRTVHQILNLTSLGNPTQTYLAELLLNQKRKTFIVSAEKAPFEAKEKLKEQGFRWSAPRKVWWRLTSEDEIPGLQKYLSSEVYGGHNHYKIEGPVDILDSNLEESLGLK